MRRSHAITRACKLAEALEARGDHRGAIDELTKVNRHARSDVVDRRLIELRSSAITHLDDSARSESWPPPIEDVFANTVGIPEIAARELSVTALRAGILGHGCLLVRGLVDAATVRSLVESIDHAFTGYDASAKTTTAVPPLAQRTFVRDAGGVLAVDSPPAFYEIVEAFEGVGLGALIAEYFGEQPVILARKLTMRRVSTRERPHPDWDPVRGPDWHQDGAFMGVDVRSVDVWLSLSDCGQDAPGLDVVPRRFDEIATTGTDGAHFDWSVGHGMVERVAGNNVVRPVFAPGDALIFDHLLLHRTAIEPSMTKDRYAIEAWFAAPSSYPHDQIPIAY
ncbi:MAG: phytanoyl-CoA dioxygenase family protein [Actinobacteria bacterium]|nr:phytanoyl-CoA dioxygenase family protein [Actinomycetota bacterium]